MDNVQRDLTPAELGTVSKYGPIGQSALVSYIESPIDGSWSFRQRDEETFRIRLSTRLRELGIRRAFLPKAGNMSGVILPPGKYTEITELPHGITLHECPHPSDGTLICQKGDAVVLGAGGCALLICPESGCVAHAGRDSLLDARVMAGKQGSRSDFSVIGAMARVSREWSMTCENLSLYSFFEIPAEDFVHPTHGKYSKKNEHMVRYLAQNYEPGPVQRLNGERCLDLSMLIMRQANAYGFKPVDVGRYSLPSGGTFAYTRHPDADMRPKRNLVIGFWPL